LFSEKIGLVKGVQASIEMKDSLPYRVLRSRWSRGSPRARTPGRHTAGRSGGTPSGLVRI
jgi:hypothetical protein